MLKHNYCATLIVAGIGSVAPAHWSHFAFVGPRFPRDCPPALSAHAALQQAARIARLSLNDVRILGKVRVSTRLPR